MRRIDHKENSVLIAVVNKSFCEMRSMAVKLGLYCYLSSLMMKLRRKLGDHWNQKLEAMSLGASLKLINR
jgi:hypothetical protein